MSILSTIDLQKCIEEKYLNNSEISIFGNEYYQHYSLNQTITNFYKIANSVINLLQKLGLVFFRENFPHSPRWKAKWRCGKFIFQNTLGK